MSRTAVVTAGTGGIGLEAALGLAVVGFAVTVAGRDAECGAGAVDRISATDPEQPGRSPSASLASPDQAPALADRFAAAHATSGEPLTVPVDSVGAVFAR